MMALPLPLQNLQRNENDAGEKNQQSQNDQLGKHERPDPDNNVIHFYFRYTTHDIERGSHRGSYQPNRIIDDEQNAELDGVNTSRLDYWNQDGGHDKNGWCLVHGRANNHNKNHDYNHHQ